MNFHRLHTVAQPKNGKGQRLTTSIFLLDDGMTAEIVTKKGESILISAEDVDLVTGVNWHVSKNGYAKRNCPSAYLHRILLGASSGQLVDHKNSDRLDCRRSNLRICGAAGNARNKSMHPSNRTGFKGVYLHSQIGKYVARICADRATRYLGCFDTAEEAHEVYCLAADMLHGEFANHGERNA
jgi:hypothetical protein